MRRLDENGFIVGWILRLIVIFAILALAVFEAGAIIVTRVQVDGFAIDAAEEAAHAYGASNGSTSKARRACRTSAESNGAECVAVSIRNGTATATVVKAAPTIVVGHISALDRFTDVSATHSAKVP